jgi:hypothetical protein
MAKTNFKSAHWNDILVITGKLFLKILGILLLAYLAFIAYVAVHEWAGHILADTLIFARHGTSIEKLDVVIQWLNITIGAGRWTVKFAPFRFGGEVVSALPHDHFQFTDWEIGFSALMGSGMTMLFSLITLMGLNLYKNVQPFPWFAIAFALCSVIFDQVLYTFNGPDPEPLIAAVLMGVDPPLFKGIVIGLVILQGWLFIRFVLHYRRSRQAK